MWQKVSVGLDFGLHFVTIHFTSVLEQACVSVAGALKISGEVEFQHCRNSNATSRGGAACNLVGHLLSVFCLLQMRKGTVSIHLATGAVHVGGDLDVTGSASFQHCHAEGGSGGAMHVDGDVWQSGLARGS